MDLNQILTPGMGTTFTFQVQEEQCAGHIGSGTLPVLATPVLVTTMEVISRKMLDEYLQEGWTSVGVSINVQHKAPTPPGAAVQMQSRVEGIDGRKVIFQVKATDHQDVIFEGVHERVAIDIERFTQRVEQKAQAIND